MKKSLSVLLALMLVLSFIGCGEDNDENDTLRISFKLDGTTVSYDHGFLEPEFGDKAFGSCNGPSVGISDETVLFSMPISTYLSNGQPETYIWIDIEIVTNADGSFNTATNGSLEYYKSGEEYDTDSFSVIITEFGEIGGLIKGTFTAVVSDNGVTNEITDGVINVERITNNLFTP